MCYVLFYNHWHISHNVRQDTYTSQVKPMVTIARDVRFYCKSVVYIRNYLCMLVRPVMYENLYLDVQLAYVSSVFRTSLYMRIIHYTSRMHGSTVDNVRLIAHPCTINATIICSNIHYCSCIMYIPSVLCTKLHRLMCQYKQK